MRKTILICDRCKSECASLKKIGDSKDDAGTTVIWIGDLCQYCRDSLTDFMHGRKTGHADSGIGTRQDGSDAGFASTLDPNNGPWIDPLVGAKNEIDRLKISHIPGTASVRDSIIQKIRAHQKLNYAEQEFLVARFTA